jgi:hypothetical protein
MNRFTKYGWLALILCLLCPLSGYAQIQLNGSVRLEVPSGGSESSFLSNEINNEFRQPHLAISQLNVFLFAPIDDAFFFEGRVQMDIWGTGRLNEPRVTLANMTWDDADKPYSVSLGRFISPFGFYSKRQLARDRVFVATPLSYDYFINISDRRGYWPQAGNSGSYTQSDVGLTTSYFGGYATGIKTFWEIEPNQWTLEAAVTNGTPATQLNYTNLANVAGIARLTYKPAIFWEQGLSVSYGSFMELAQINQAVRSNNPLEQYRQLVAGTDFKFGYSHFEIVGELIYSNWSVPSFQNGFFQFEQGNQLAEYSLNNAAVNIDVKYELPFLAGSYVAVRGERIQFFEADNPQSDERIQWDENITRLTGVAGYKISRNIIGKISYSDQTPFDGTKHAFRIQVSAFF